MKKYTFKSYDIFANSDDEAWEIIQESLQENEITDCFTCIETEISFEDYKKLNLLDLTMEQLANLTEANLQDYISNNL